MSAAARGDRPDPPDAPGLLRRAVALTRPYAWVAALAVVAGVVAAATMLTTPADGVLVGLVVLAGGLVVRALGEGEHHVWVDPPAPAHRGARRAVTALSWTLTGRDGRVAEGALRRLREDARRRLALRGVHVPVTPSDADHLPAEAVDRARALLGDRVWHLLTTRGTPPTIREVEHCVRVLEELVPATTDAGALAVTPSSTSDGRTPA